MEKTFDILLESKINKYDELVRDKIYNYFANNKASQGYLELCTEKNWPLNLDHLTIRTNNIDSAAKQYENLDWKYDEKLEYKSEGWWAKIYRHDEFAPFFIDQSYDEWPEDKKIITNWVKKFGDQDFHHIAVLLPPDIKMEMAIESLKAKNIKFLGQITGQTGNRLRQVFSQAELVDGIPFTVLELVERNIDIESGEIYKGFIGEQADSLMKDSTLI